MPVSVPSADEFNALAARVTALEHGTPPTPPINQASKDGTKATDPSTVLTDDQLDQWRLTAGQTIEWLPHGTTNWLPAGTSAQVTAIEKWKATCYQTSPNPSSFGQPGWWAATKVPGNTIAWNDAPGDPSVATPLPPSGGGWTVSNGLLYRGGKQIVPYGPAVLDGMMGQVSPALVKQRFPTATLVNLAVGADGNGALSAKPDAQIFGWVDAARAQSLMVVLSDYVPGQPQARGGNDLTNVCNWYNRMARHYAGVDDVIWTTSNEVSGNLSPSHQAIYQAIRSGGSNSVIFMESQDGNATTTNGLDASAYANMTCVGWNIHIYPWEFDRSHGDQGYYDQQCRNFIRTFQNFAHSHDGVMPVAMLEGGNSTAGSGSAPDDAIVNGQYAVVAAMLNVSTGKPGEFCACAPWLWSWYGQVSPGSGDADTLVSQSVGNLTKYGQQCSAFHPPTF